MYTLQPQEHLVSIQSTPNKGYGVFAKGCIAYGQELGVYAGRLMSGLEVAEVDSDLRIQKKHAVGVSAYIKRLSTPPPANSAPPTRRNRARPYTAILAVRRSGSCMEVLVDWEGHRVPSWTKATKAHLRSLRIQCPSDGAGLGPDPMYSAPGFYDMYIGDLRPVYCCFDCSKSIDGLAYDSHVDASHLGNVSLVTAMLLYDPLF
ncbi:unnamed protein product [Peniophora sp. CBMAI 1063]|nr:unnamed protein product [Peniophora sp. CBMAI 1063]